MSYLRKLEDARHHLRKCGDEVTEAHCQANQTGKAVDRQRYIEALRAEQEAEDALEIAEAQSTQGGAE